MAVEIYTIGFTKRTARDFFETLKRAKVERLLDIRLYNTSHLAGFSKFPDLSYFLEQICGIEYQHMPLLAPTPDILHGFKRDRTISWQEYERRFLNLLEQRKVEQILSTDYFEKKRACC